MTYYRANSNNLPEITPEMVAEFFSNNEKFVFAEGRGEKAKRSTKASYSGNAIGYVQVKREGSLCFVRARVTPEHKVKSSPYIVVATIDEEAGSIREATCDACAASQGGCKHVITFVSWLLTEAEKPSPTEVQSYWRKSALSSVSTASKKITEMFKKKTTFKVEVTDAQKESIINSVTTNSDSLFMSYAGDPSSGHPKEMSLHMLRILYEKKHKRPKTWADFAHFCFEKMESDLCIKIEKQTRNQSDSHLWHALRWSRVTASKLFECSRSKTYSGALRESILGGRALKGSAAMLRGKALEPLVRKEVNRITISTSGFKPFPTNFNISGDTNKHF